MLKKQSMCAKITVFGTLFKCFLTIISENAQKAYE